MECKHTLFFRALIVLWFYGQFCAGKIDHATVAHDNRLVIQLSEAFGFGSSGYVNITLKGITLETRKHTKTPHEPDMDKLGFILLNPADSLILDEASAQPNWCPLDSNAVQKPQNSSQEKPRVWKRFTDGEIVKAYTSKTEVTLTGKVTGKAMLLFANCDNETLVSFKARIVMYNLDAGGNVNYLPVGEKEFSTLFWVMFSLFAVAALAWSWILWTCRDNVHKIHYLMLALVVFKTLTVLCQAGMYHYLALTGQPDGWNIAYYIFTFARGMLFFTVIVLVGTGWSLMKPYLGDRERNILMVVIPLQVFANIAIIVVDEESPAVRDWLTWNDIFHLMDILCCCAILFPIVWSIKHLREAAQTDGKAAACMEKLLLFRQFYVMVVVYIYFTRIVVNLLEYTMEYQYEWLGEAANELATLAFYVWTGVSFRPHKESAYYRLHSAHDEDV